MSASFSRKLMMMKVSVRVLSMSGEAWNVGHGDDGELRHVLLHRVDGRRLEEHVAREEAVPGLLGDDPDRQAVLRIGAGVAVLDEDVPALQVALQAGVEHAEVLRD